MDEFQQVPLAQIAASRHQARKEFDEENLKGLAESMRQEGLLQPIVVRIVSADRREGVSASTPSETLIPQYELVSGERRLRAAQLLGWKTILARVITTVSEGEAAAK